MNHYQFENLYIGMEEKFEVEITENMMHMFSQMTGDYNPLHTDKKFAKVNNYADCVVYGMLTASFISTLGGMYLPGRQCLIQSVESKFVRPVYVGDVLTISGVVVKRNATVRQAEIKVVMRNQRQEKVLRGKLKVGFLNA